MPKVVSYNAPWLSRPSPGYGLFSSDRTAVETASPKRHGFTTPVSDDIEEYNGPRKLIAHRGTEVFNVVGKQIRWADLSELKNNWEEAGHEHGLTQSTTQKSLDQEEEAHEYRILSVSIHQDIRQIITSPSGHFLAILTSHTVHVAVLPPQIRLHDSDRRPLKLRTWQIGRTAHCLGDGTSPVITALWHPLALANTHMDCLVTLTVDAVVRVWELDRQNTFTMDHPTLAVDLKKLADGQSCDDDYAPSGIGKVQAFSPDVFEMEVASACFGGQGYEDEDGWASMTLWVAMRNGDVYALCPLLPTRWTPSSTLIPSLSTSVVSKLALLQDGDFDKEEAKAIRQQYQWVREIDEEEPALGTPDSDSTPAVVIRKRPSNPSPIPRLQGPFIPDLPESSLEELEVSDILVIAAKTQEGSEYASDEEEEIPETGSTTVLCLSTVDGKVLICLNPDNVEGQWLPKTKKVAFTVPNTEASELLVLDTVDAPKGSVPDDQWPSFTPDIYSPYGFFLTTASTVQYYSLDEWIPRLESEMNGNSFSNDVDSGLAFRLKILCESDIVLHEEVLRIDSSEGSNHLSASLVLESYNIGYFLLTATPSQPYTVIFDDVPFGPSQDSELFAIPQAALNDTPAPEPVPPRPAYTPAAAFYEPTGATLLQNMLSQIPSRHRAMLKSEVRMSAATLDIMTTAHRTISSQTAALERNAAELFRRVERLRSEVHDAVEQMVNLAERVQKIQEDTYENEKGSLDDRIAYVDIKQQELISRYEALKRKVARVGPLGSQSKELSAKEVAWAEEIKKIGKNVGVDVTDAEADEEDVASLKARYQKAKSLTSALLSQVKSVASESTPDPSLPQSKPNDSPAEKSLEESLLKRSSSPAPGSSIASLREKPFLFSGSRGSPNVSEKIKKKLIDDAMAMVEQEGLVIEETVKRLKALGVSDL